jgi:hypothetical protein
MHEFSRPDVTTEGWHTWPTEKASHLLVRDPRLRATVQAHAAVVLETMPPDVAALALVPTVRDVIESGLRYGEAEELRESLMTFALSRVDWLQLAAAEIEAATPEEPEPVGIRTPQACPA